MPEPTPFFTPLAGLAIVSLAARPQLPLAETVERLFAIPLPAPGHSSETNDLAFVSTSPNRWLALSLRQSLYADLLDPLASLASIIDLTDSLSLLRLSGPGARDVLQKGAPIDLHPRAMHAGMAASTLIAHITVLIWQRTDAPTYDIACPSSSTASFRSWLAGAIDRPRPGGSAPCTPAKG
jgi:methylglutamate dehydrogenase subunit D